jgi:hypothetical protein
MNVARLSRTTSAVLTLGVGLAFAQSVSETPGPAVGAKVPGFQLSDQTGASHSLESLMGPKGLMLVFFRSADW